MGRPGTNNGGGPRWGTMPRAKCPRCGLVKFVGVLQSEERHNICNNIDKCNKRRAKREAKHKETT